MKYSVKGYSIEIYPDDGFNLKNTFECGQCFRWDRQTDDSYFGIAHGKCLCVSASENRIILRSCSEEDYLKGIQEVDKEPIIKDLFQQFKSCLVPGAGVKENNYIMKLNTGKIS